MSTGCWRSRGSRNPATTTSLHESVVAWISAQEREHAFLVLEADADWTAWTRRVLRQADRVLIVGRAGDDPAPGARRDSRDRNGTDGAQRARAAAAGRVRAADRHAGVARAAPRRRAPPRASRPRRRPAPPRAARERPRDRPRARRRRRARLRAHRDAARAGRSRCRGRHGRRHQHRRADRGGHARGVSASTGCSSSPTSFASPKKLLDRTLPITSLMAGRKVTTHLPADVRRVADRGPVDSACSSCRAVSSRAHAVVHDRGAVWRAVRASTAIPAIFPPLLADDGEVLVDGGVMNNMPLDVMRERCEGGTVIGLNPMPTNDKMTPYDFGPSLVGLGGAQGALRLVRLAHARAVDHRQRDARDRDQQRQPDAPAVVPVARGPPDRAAARRLPDPRLRRIRADHRHRLPERAGGARRLEARAAHARMMGRRAARAPDAAAAGPGRARMVSSARAACRCSSTARPAASTAAAGSGGRRG